MYEHIGQQIIVSVAVVAVLWVIACLFEVAGRGRRHPLLYQLWKFKLYITTLNNRRRKKITGGHRIPTENFDRITTMKISKVRGADENGREIVKASNE